MQLLSFDQMPVTPAGTTDKKQPILSDSVACKYIPFHAGFESTVITKKQGEVLKKVLLYSEIVLGTMYAVHSGDLNLITDYYLKSMRLVKFLRSRSAHSYAARKGMVYYYSNKIATFNYTLTEEDFYLLLMLGVEGKYLFEIDKENPDYKRFCLFVDYRYFSKENAPLRTIFNPYIEACKAVGMNIMYTANIKPHVYKNSFEFPTFESVQDMRLYLENLKKSIYE